MNNTIKKGSVATLSLVAVVGLAGCGAADEAATQTGEALDGAVEVVSDTAEGATDAVVDGGEAMMDDAQKMAGDAMDKAGDAMEEDHDGTMKKEAVMVGGAEMLPTKNIIENAVNSKDHTTLVAAVTAADLVETLSGPGPFTVFAPVNSAFEALPAGTVDTLLLPENKADLAAILTYHVVPAKAMSTDVVQMVADGGGSHEVTTVQGGTLILKADAGKVTVTDESGNVATVTIADVEQSNGVIHVIDTVLLPAS